MGKQINSKAIGIDLGTTNSVVALMNPSDTDTIIHSDSNGRQTTPSCVWKDPKNGEIVVGRKAFSRIGNKPLPIRSIKRLMGTAEKVMLTDELKKPEEISACVLREMKRQIEEDVLRLNTDSSEWVVDRAIITIPAYFDQPQIDATRQAGEMAGLQILELLHEPSAAACYHCYRTNTRNGLFLVYDLGGGTFDVSIVRCTEGEFEVLGISGNNQLGGDDIDTLLAEELQQRLIRDGYDLNLDVKNDLDDKLSFEKLKRLAEGVKKALSNNTEYLLRDTTTLRDKSGEEVEIEMAFERQELEKLMLPLVERTILYCFDALEKAEQKAGVTLSDVDAIIFAGGSTHIPVVREMVRKSLCADPSIREPRAKCTEPVYKEVDTIVALGAALRAAATGGLVAYGSKQTVRVSFRGIGATDRQKTHIGGQVEALDPHLDLSEGYIRLSVPGMHFEDEQELKKNGTFGFTSILLQPSSENFLTFEIHDRSGKLIATVERSVTQSTESLRPTGGSSGTAKLSKEMILEVNNGGIITQEVLFEALTTIPASVKRIYSHPGDIDFIRLPIYQNKKKIQEIHIPDCWQPKGTLIDITVEMDNLSQITVRVKIGERNVNVTVKLPPERTLPTREEVESLNQKFQTAVSYLPTKKRVVVEARYKKAKQGYVAEVKREDHRRAIHEFEEMEELLVSVSNGNGRNALEPPKDDFDTLVRNCVECNRYLRQYGSMLDQPHDSREMAKAIEAQRIQGEKAYEAEDQVTYSDAFSMLESIHSHLIMLLLELDSRTEKEKAVDSIEYTSQEAEKLEQLASKVGNRERQNEIRVMKQKLNDLEQRIQHDPGTNTSELYQINAQLQRIENELVDVEKRDQLIRGLVETYNKKN